MYRLRMRIVSFILFVMEKPWCSGSDEKRATGSVLRTWLDLFYVLVNHGFDFVTDVTNDTGKLYHSKAGCYELDKSVTVDQHNDDHNEKKRNYETFYSDSVNMSIMCVRGSSYLKTVFS